MAPSLEKIKEDLVRVNKQRIFWLLSSGFVTFVICSLVWEWHCIRQNHLELAFVSAGLTLIVIWWYWTMRLIRMTLSHRHSEVEMLNDVVNEIKEIKTEVSKLRE